MIITDICSGCGSVIPKEQNFCSCGGERSKYADNYCTNDSCGMYKVNLVDDPQARTCTECGSRTLYGAQIDAML